MEDAHVARLDDLEFVMERGISAYLLTLNSFKHSNGRKAKLRLFQKPIRTCPVHWLSVYLSFRRPSGSYLFQQKNGKPVTRDMVMRVMRNALAFVGESPVEYGTHSFRIGRCTDLARFGYTDAQLRSVGRWNSDAFKLYVKPDIIDC